MKFLFLSITNSLFAVPRSQIIQGAPYLLIAPIESAIKSVPNSLGLSILIESPDLISFERIKQGFCSKSSTDFEIE